MSTEPEFVSQTGETSTPAQRLAWCESRAAEAGARGLRHARYSYDQEHNLLLAEFWKVRPDDEGEPRYGFANVSA